jgi:predicted nucleotidyltransferase/DNA-binding XRE family transcriptional regulator
MTSPLDIGPGLVSQRIAIGVTQRELARRVGVQQPQIARWEATAYRTAALARVDSVARALGVDIALAPPLAAEAPAIYAATPLATDTGTRALARLGVTPETVAAFCRLHGIRELALFGSSVRTDFGESSDVDVLVTWAEDAEPLDFGTLDDLRLELRGIFRRDVDLVDRGSVERSDNYIRRSRILDGARSVYVAR